jgi:aminomethyltransferase
VIEAQLAKGVARQRVLLRPEGKAPVREGAEVVDANGSLVGKISSGGFGPSLGAPIAMGYVDTAALDAPLFALVRNKQIALQRQRGPFVPQRYFR